MRRHQRRFEEGRLAALGHAGGYPKGRLRLSVSRTRQVDRLKAQGLSNRQIASRLGVTEKAVRKILWRLGWKEPKPAQARLPIEGSAADPNLSAIPSADAPLLASMDTDAADRRYDRLMAYLGLLDDAAPMFPPSTRG